MKAVILAGGEGTRLRPLTLATPKPVVPVVDRPFLSHQLDLLAGASVHEIVFSVAYQPEQVRAVFGDGHARGVRIHYAVESTPLGTGGAVKNAEPYLDARTIVLNGDILTDVDLRAVVAEHDRSGAAATLVLTPVPNPAAYGLVETDADGRVRRFIEKPAADQITTNTINAGIYILETATLGLIPPRVNHSIERGFFPDLLRRGDHVRAHVHRGYWIDIGTPEKYMQVHRDILHDQFHVALDGEARHGGWIHATAEVDASVQLAPPFYIGPGSRVAAEAVIGPDTVLTSRVDVGRAARVRRSVLWPGNVVGEHAEILEALLGSEVHVRAHARVGSGTVLGEASRVSEYSCTGSSPSERAS